MTIKGLTDRNMAFPEIGQIRKGAAKVEGENRPGKDLPYFRVIFDENEAKREALFRAKYGDKPDEINIVFPFDDIGSVWSDWYEAYTAGRMVARSDGEKFIYLVDVRNGEIKVKNGLPWTEHTEIVGQYKSSNGKVENIKMKPTGRLRVVIPELQSFAYLMVHTTSLHDIINIGDQLRAIQAVHGGHIAGIPLVMRRRPKKVSTPNADGTRARRTKYLISIEADPEWVKRKLMEMKNLALPGNGLSLLPTNPAQEPEPDIEDGHYEPDEDEVDEAGLKETAEELSGVQKPDAAPGATMVIETACSTKSSDGTEYGDIQTKDLAHHINALEKSIKDNGLTVEEKTEKQFKRDCIKAIFAWRSANPGKMRPDLFDTPEATDE